MNKKILNFWEAVATIVGTIVGAGMLGIPYVLAKAGFFTGLILLLFLGVSIMFVHLFLERNLMSRLKHLVHCFFQLRLEQTDPNASPNIMYNMST